MLALAGCTLSASFASADDEKSSVTIDGTTTEITLHAAGLLDDTANLVRLKMRPMLPPADGATLPASVDLSDDVPTPGDQGRQGSCVGWAVGYAAKTYQEVQEEGWSPNLSGNQFSPSWIYNQINGGVDGGSYYSDALDLLVNAGADTLGHFSYDQNNFTRQPSSTSLAFADHYKAASWNTLPVNADIFKTVLAGGTPIMIGMQVLPDWDALNDSTNLVYDTAAGTRPSCATAPCSRGGHAVTIIGYDDAMNAFRVINSWGTAFWGDGGYGWIDYAFITDPDLKLRAYMLVDDANDPFPRPPAVISWHASTISIK